MLATHVLLLASCTAAMLQTDMQFYTKIRKNENCEICYGSGCYTIDKTRCEYYRQTENILWDGPENPEEEDSDMKTTIDGYLMEYVHEGPWAETECIPLISQFTNCNRENICTGCLTCNCDGTGSWNCTNTQQCAPHGIRDINHRTLVVVMEKLKDYLKVLQRKKIKRSIMYEDVTKKEINNYKDILKLLYGTENYENNNNVKTTDEIVNQNNTGKRVNDIDYNMWDTETLNFEDLLNIDDYAQNIKINSKDKADVVKLNDTNSGHSKSNGKNKDSDIVYMKPVKISAIIDYLNNIDETVNRNLKKREIVLNSDKVQDNSSIITNNSSTNIKELKDNVLYPLFKIVDNKQREVNQLINIKDKLIIYFKSFTDIDITKNATNSSGINDNQHLYFYQLEIPAELQDDIRKHSPNIVEKYLQKLKRDLFEVIKDVTNIQRLSNSSTIPHDLKVLMRAIKYYAHQKKYVSKIIGPKKSENATNFVDHIIDIFETLDKNIPLANALEPVSKRAKQVLQRIINQFYIDDIDEINTKGFDPEYDITNVLIEIGSGWDQVIESIYKNQLADHLYSMKLLQIKVITDIRKIRLALELLQFLKHRRILFSESIGKKIISKIGDDLNRLNRLVKQIAKSKSHVKRYQYDISKQNQNKPQPYTISNKKNDRKKKTFFQTIKKLLRKSKKDIRDLFHKKLPKLDIVKHIAKKKNDEITKRKFSEYEEAIQRWQNNLNVRNKRSTIEDIGSFFNRLKNIIPNYLRGIVPAKRKGKGNGTKSLRRKGLQRGHNQRKKTKMTSTTPILYMHR